jgi:hypothetical protein
MVTSLLNEFPAPNANSGETLTTKVVHSWVKMGLTEVKEPA